MSAIRSSRIARRQSGRTLIEVMVAITIGLMLTAGVLSIYSANRQTFRTSTDVQRMQAAGQIALDRLAYQIRMAGYAPLTQGGPVFVGAFTGTALQPCSGGFANPLAAPSAAPNPPLACQNDPNAPDGLLVSYRVDDNPAALESGNIRDCLGAVVPQNAAGERITSNRFYVAPSTSANVPTLMCASYAEGPGGVILTQQAAPLVPNIEDLQIRLRVGDPFGRAEQVLPPENVASLDRVLAVELCVQVVSENTGLTTGPQAGTDCRNGAFPNDGRLRRTFTQVVTLRNRML